MRGQLEYLLSLDLPHVMVQVVPGPLHPAGTDGSFVLATLPDRTELADVETAVRGITVSETEDIRLLSDAYDQIRSRALPVDMSKDLIRRILEELWT